MSQIHGIEQRRAVRLGVVAGVVVVPLRLAVSDLLIERGVEELATLGKLV